MSELACPFCNASLTDATRSAADAPVACPRCGERLPADVRERLPIAATEANETAPPVAAIPGKRKTIQVLLAIMVTAAAMGALFVVTTRQFRRDNDYRTQKKNPIDPGAGEAADTSIVGYLPARCNVVASIHVSEMLRQPGTRQFFQDTPPKVIETALDKVKEWSGLGLADLERVAAGAEISDSVPQIYLLVQTRKPYDAGKLKATGRHLGKPMARLPLRPAGEAILWAPSERLLAIVVAFDAAKPQDLDAIAQKPRVGLDGLSPALVQAATERLPAGSVAWCAGYFEKPSAVGDLLGLFGTKAGGLDLLLTARAFVLSLQSGAPVTVTGHFQARDALEAGRLEERLEAGRWPATTSWKVVVAPSETPTEPARWVTLQVRGDPSAWLSSWGNAKK